VRTALIVCAGVLAGCVSASEIVPAGKDTYMVAGRANGGPAAGGSSIEAMKAANAFCAKQQKLVMIRNTSTSGSAGFGGEQSTLIFSCLTADDPEYQRPNLRKDNGVTTIENR
jgi:hypothetical protein